MNNLSAKLDAIFAKVAKLRNAHVQLKQDYKLLKEVNSNLLLQLEEKKQQITLLEQELKVAVNTPKIVQTPAKDHSELKKKINEFINEIDHCVELLSK